MADIAWHDGSETPPEPTWAWCLVEGAEEPSMRWWHGSMWFFPSNNPAINAILAWSPIPKPPAPVRQEDPWATERAMVARTLARTEAEIQNRVSLVANYRAWLDAHPATPRWVAP